MAKIVYNACYGGFGLSKAAIDRYAALKGLKLYEKPEDGTVSQSLRQLIGHGDLYLDANFTQYFSDYDIARNDPALAAVVEEMGAAANGQSADLQIRDLAPGTRYRIDKYDGNESVTTDQEYDWEIA